MALLSILVFVAVVSTFLQGPLSGSAGVVAQNLRAIGNLSDRDDNRTLLGAAGACKGGSGLLKKVFSFTTL